MFVRLNYCTKNDKAVIHIIENRRHDTYAIKCIRSSKINNHKDYFLNRSPKMQLK